jgi:hypothetical protein
MAVLLKEYAESLGNVLAVHLIRHILAPRQPAHGRDGKLRVVLAGRKKSAMSK